MSAMVVRDQMTRSLYEISACSSIERAKNMMRDNRIRHLPVFDQGELVGVISDRDVRQIRDGEESRKTYVGNLMSQRLYVVREYEPLKNVVREMFEQKYGSAIVVDEKGWTKGIFTTIDALELLEKFLCAQEPIERKNFATIEEYLVGFDRQPDLVPA